jgi:hypothetical protein
MYGNLSTLRKVYGSEMREQSEEADLILPDALCSF